jgi:hypothetical protein
MQTWEYNTVFIRLYEVKGWGFKKSSYEWTATAPDGEELKGMCAILDYYGSRGWELVSVTDEYRGGTTVSTQVEVYRAFFKRPVQPENASKLAEIPPEV